MTTSFTPAEAFTPGEHLRDELAERGWTADEFAKIIGRPAHDVADMLDSREDITPKTALALAKAFGTSADLWLNLQTAYGRQVEHSGAVDARAASERCREDVDDLDVAQQRLRDPSDPVIDWEQTKHASPDSD